MDSVESATTNLPPASKGNSTGNKEIKFAGLIAFIALVHKGVVQKNEMQFFLSDLFTIFGFRRMCLRDFQ